MQKQAGGTILHPNLADYSFLSFLCDGVRSPHGRSSCFSHPAPRPFPTCRWSPKRSSVDSDAGVVDEIRMRLDAAYAANITVFAPAGFDSATTRKPRVHPALLPSPP